MTHARASTLALGLATLLGLSQGRPAIAQGVAYEPTIGTVPNGISMSTTPVVSADRRYVRLGVNFQSTAIQSFNTVAIPLAVSGSPGGHFQGGMNGLLGQGQNQGQGPVMGSYEATALMSGFASVPNGSLIGAGNDYGDEMPAPRPRAIKRKPAKKLVRRK